MEQKQANLFRQGDVLFIRLNDKPIKKKADFKLSVADGIRETTQFIGKAKWIKKPKKAVFAYGEVTGHAHQVIEADLDKIKVLTNDDGTVRIMEVNDEVTVKHEEHDPIILPPGDYEIRTQREYDPERGFRQVLD